MGSWVVLSLFWTVIWLAWGINKWAGSVKLCAYCNHHFNKRYDHCIHCKKKVTS